MAAYAALTSLMRVIHDLETHPSPPISLDKPLLDSITQSITFFQEFLHSYIADDDEEEAADPLEMRIAGAAHAAEDAIEYHIVECVKQKTRIYKRSANDDVKINSITQCCGILQSVIQEMDSIKKVVLVDTNKLPMMQVVHDQVAPASVVDRNESLVGSDAVLLEIMEKLAGGQLDFQVIPIVGMGGIGKTFLAKAIYAKPLIKERFDICAWATISQHYDAGEILSELLSRATNTTKNVDELGLELHQYLFSRRFLIVMDDMWSTDSWDRIQCYFPNNHNGSRVLVTTRLSQLSSQLNNHYSLHMSFLDKASSWDLFSRTVFGDKSSCPPELKEMGEKIVDNCRGLPLSISVVGGLLKKMAATRASWESIRHNITSVVNMENDKHCLRLLKLSYNHLPIYLKPCFLYMGVFEEDKNIRVSELVQQWVSEGFLKPTNGEALETTARGFLMDLIDRNLILIGELGSTGRLKFCKLHDLVRDMCVKEGRKEGFHHVIRQRSPPPQGMNTQRRVVISMNTSEYKVRGDLRFLSHARLVICEHDKVELCRDLVLLRTLHADAFFSVPNFENCPESLVFCFFNLRHLGIKASCISSFLPSVSLLWNLHTLVVFNFFSEKPTMLPDFWNMPQFRHIEFVDDRVCLLDPPNCDGDAAVIMENLHTLKGIRNLKCSEGLVKRIPNIKTLKLEYSSNILPYVDDDEDVYFLGNMKCLCTLEFLSVSLYSPGPTTPMQTITFPHSLKKLSLFIEFGLEFEWDDMLEMIGSLPLLEKLRLQSGCFGNGKWEIAEEHFPCLKYLDMCLCKGLKILTASEEDSFILPRLENLKLGYLVELEEIPLELGNIDTLKIIELICCGEGAVKSAKEMFDEQVELQGGEDQLSFHVEVTVRKNQQHLLSLAGPKFNVTSNPNIILAL